MLRRLQEDVMDPNHGASRVYYQYPEDLKIKNNHSVVVHDDENDKNVHFQNPDELDTNDSKSVVVHDDDQCDFYPPVYPNNNEIDLDKKPNISSPVDMVKADPKSISIGQRSYSDKLPKFFVDSDDVIRHAEINNESVIEAFDNIVACNENNGVYHHNTFMVMNENNIRYAKPLEDRGIRCIEFTVTENADSSVNIHENYAGPNPINVFKKRYDSVPIAMDEDAFFADAEDVCKCASINEEHIGETINKIIGIYESSGMNSNNFNVVVNEYTDDSIISELENMKIGRVYRND